MCTAEKHPLRKLMALLLAIARTPASLLSLTLSMTMNASVAAVVLHAMEPAAGSATFVENLIGENARLSGEGVSEIPTIAYDFASDFPVAARAQIHHIATDKAIKSGITEKFQQIFARVRIPAKPGHHSDSCRASMSKLS